MDLITRAYTNALKHQKGSNSEKIGDFLDEQNQIKIIRAYVQTIGFNR